MKSLRFPIWQALAAFVAVGMLLQLSWQLPEVYYRVEALAAGAALLIFGAIAGAIASHSLSTQRTVRLLAFFFFVVLGVQWANSFRDDYLIWALRWLCVGLLSGTLVKNHENPVADTEEDEVAATRDSTSDLDSTP